MATEGRRSSAAVMERLRAAPQSFAFFQAVRLLEAHGEGQPVGHDHAPASENVRFRARPSLAFPGSEVLGLRETDTDLDGEERDRGAGSRPRELEVAFFGLIGPLGVLPAHYNELVLERLRLRDTTLRDFLDLFHHRALSFFYRAWRKYRLPFEFEAAEQASGEDTFTRAFLSVAGLGSEALRGRTHLDDLSFAYYSGQLAHRPRSAAGLEGLLGDYFGFRVRIEQFVGQWLDIPPGQRSSLAAFPLADAPGLGQGFVLGSRTFDVRSKIRVHAGPLSYRQYRAIVPGSPGHDRLRDLTRLYLGPGMDFDLVVELAPGMAPPFRLGGDEEGAASLGRSGWLVDNPATARVEPAVFCMAHSVAGEGEGWQR